MHSAEMCPEEAEKDARASRAETHEVDVPSQMYDSTENSSKGY